MVALDPTMQMAIPFLFVFAVVFGVLELTLKQWSKPVKAVIALALSLFSIGYAPFTTFLWSQMGNITVFFIVMFFIAFIVESFGLKKNRDSAEMMIITTVVLLLLLSIGWILADSISFDIPVVGDSQGLMLIIGLVFIGIIFWNAYKAGTYTAVAEASVKAKQKGG